MMELEGLEALPWLFGAAAGTSAALARPPSHPRRVPGGTVAGVWEPSPAGPRAGAAREGEALAAVAQPLGQRPPRRPSWALALALSGPSLVQLRGALGRGAAGKADREQWVPTPYRSGGGRGSRLGRVSRQKEAEDSQPMD